MKHTTIRWIGRALLSVVLMALAFVAGEAFEARNIDSKIEQAKEEAVSAQIEKRSQELKAEFSTGFDWAVFYTAQLKAIEKWQKPVREPADNMMIEAPWQDGAVRTSGPYKTVDIWLLPSGSSSFSLQEPQEPADIHLSSKTVKRIVLDGKQIWPEEAPVLVRDLRGRAWSCDESGCRLVKEPDDVDWILSGMRAK